MRKAILSFLVVGSAGRPPVVPGLGRPDVLQGSQKIGVTWVKECE